MEKFKRGYTASTLLKKHSLDECGIWEVRGEDENCGMAGAHYTPLLGYFEGKLSDVIEHAVGLNRFWQWGGGGEINHVEIQIIK